MKNKLTKKQIEELNELAYDAYELTQRMLEKIEMKTRDGTKGWQKMTDRNLLILAEKKIEQAKDGLQEQILDAMNYLLFAWIKAGRP